MRCMTGSFGWMCWKRMGTGCGLTKERPGWMAHDRTDRGVGSRRSGIPGRNSGSAARENLPAAGGATRLHPEGEWEAEAVGDTDGDFIMHLLQLRLAMLCHSGFCSSSAPSLGASVRLFR